MQKTITRNGKTYELLKGYEKNDNLRLSFDRLAQETFQLSFETWYQKGYWGKDYLLYSLIFEGEVVANVAVNFLQFRLFQKEVRYIEIGTVMTKESFRHEGLSRFLMEQVLSDFEHATDLIFLYANDSVLTFYPKFGFQTGKEFFYSKRVPAGKRAPLKKLSMENPQDIALLKSIAKDAIPLSDLAFYQNTGLLFFYCLQVYKDHIYYLEEKDTIIILLEDEDEMTLVDVFTRKKDLSLSALIDSLSPNTDKTLILGFTPMEKEGFTVSPLKEEDTTLFLRGKDAVLFDEHCLSFPQLAHT